MEYLVAVDGSDGSRAAVDHAKRVARRSGGSVTLVHAVDPGSYANAHAPAADDRHHSVDDAARHGRELLAEFAADLRAEGVSVGATHLRFGEPATVLTDLATADDVAEVVVGHRGLPAQSGRVLGSVAKDVIDDAPVPVTVVGSG